MAAPLTPEELKKYRPYRGLAWAIYVASALTLSSVVIYSVGQSVVAMSPGRPKLAGETLSPTACTSEGQRLFDELDARRKQLTEGAEVQKAEGRWNTFRVEWMTRLKTLEARCTPEAPGREALKPVFAGLEDAMNVYTTNAVQFAGQVGPTVDELKKSLGQTP